MRYLATATVGLLAMSGAAFACPTYSQQGASYTYSGDQLYSPQSFGVVAGGQNNIRNCGIPGVNRTGWVTSAPDFTFYLSGMDQYYLVADVDAECDSVLLVNTANATWLFDDDSNGNLDPRLEIQGAQNLNGRVDVWVGTYGNQYCNATLNMETWFAQAPAPQPQPQPVPQPQPQPQPQPVPTPTPVACPTWQYQGQIFNFTGNDLYSPRAFGAQAQGGARLRDCGLDFPGYASTAPQYSFNLSGMDQYYLVLDVDSQCDSSLLVNTANGSWLFDDDSRGNLDPRLEIQGAQNLNGRVDVWVGTYGNTTCAGTLNAETFYAQAPAPQPQPQPVPQPQPQPQPQPAGQCPTYQLYGQQVNVTGQILYSPQSYQVQAGGNMNISSCNVGGRGYANAAPHYSFNLSGMDGYGRLEIEVSASCDTTLLVNTPTAQWMFDDDSNGNLQPLLNVPSGGQLNGRLDVWVGTYNGSSCPATLELETWYN